MFFGKTQIAVIFCDYSRKTEVFFQTDDKVEKNIIVSKLVKKPLCHIYCEILTLFVTIKMSGLAVEVPEL